MSDIIKAPPAWPVSSDDDWETGIVSPRNAIDLLFAPRSVVVIGASEDPHRIGGRTIWQAIRHGYQDSVYPVNPKRETVQGLRCYPTIGAIEGPIDCAIVAVPAAVVAQALRECGAVGVKAAIIFSSGFAELGEEGRRAQKEITQIARETGMRVVGPNCIGFIDAVAGRYMTFLRELPGPCDPELPRIGLVSQSGGYGAHILHLAITRGLQVSKFATTGNEADVAFGEVLAHLAASPDVDIILGYIEGIADAHALIGGLKLAQHNRKPVILMKVGSTERGAAAAASHTAALAGADEAYDAVFRRYGAYRARTTEEVLDIAYALRAAPRGLDPKLAVVTVSGGAGVQIADFAEERGLALEAPSDQLKSQLRTAIPYAAPNNPIDVTAQIGSHPDLFGRLIEMMIDEGFNAFLLWLGPTVTNPKLAQPFLAAVRAVLGRRPDIVLIVSMLASTEVERAYQTAGCLLFEEAARGIRGLAAMRYFAESFATPEESAGPTRHSVAIPFGSRLNEYEALQLLHAAGLEIPATQTATDAEIAARAAERIGMPVALKILSGDIAHKSDVGGVALNLSGMDEVRAAAERMLRDVPRAAPDARIDGLLVEPMLGDGVDCIIAVHRDPTFGPVIMFGTGGVLVEVMEDVVFATAPVSETEARRMVGRIKGRRLLEGYRGAPVADTDALVQAIVAVSDLAAANADRLRTIEINPIRVFEHGAVVLDAVIETEAA